MEQVPLQQYCQEVEGLIERSAYDEAAAHCRHILQQYPKYIEAYRLLGKVALDREDDKQATELFARVLSADPADFVSRAGLSIIYDRQGLVRDAVWQMERAYELAPGNSVVQQELRKLYARRDGAEPAKIPLTRGALARLYFNGELHTEAIAELRAMLAQEPDRVDLQALLAEALWRDDQRLEAADTALRVLDRLPYCLDANLILGEIWMSSGREEDADVHLKRAQALDPLATRANMLFGKSSPVPAQPVEVTHLSYTPPAAASTAEDQVPEWLAGMGGQAEPGPGGEEVPAWLQGIGQPSPQPEPTLAAEPAPGLRATVPPQATPPIEEEIPDWLTGLGTPPAQPEAPAPTIEGEAAPDWLRELRGAAAPEAEQPAAEEAVPDWLKQLGGPAAPEAEQPSAEEGAPDWLARLRTEAGPIPGAEVEAAPAAPTPEAETPEWLKAFESPVTEQAAPPAETSPESAEIPDWLQAIRPEGAEEPAPPPAEEAPTEMPDWLSQMRAGVVPEAAVGAPSAGPEPAEIPDWLQALRPEGTEQPAPPVEEAPGAPDWLSQLSTGVAPVPGMEAEAAQAEPLPAPEPGEIPDWLKTLEPQDVEPTAPTPVTPAAPEKETPAWMTGEGAMPSPEEAMAFFQKLTAGKEVELQAQAQAAAEARMADIMGRKPAAAPAPTPEPVTPPPPTPVQAPPEAPPAPSAETPAWMTGEGAMPSPEEALAFFQTLTAGKEAELQAQAQAEAEARMADIMGRKPAAAPAPAPEPVMPPPAPAEPASVPPTPPQWEEEVPLESALPEAETPEWLAALMQAEAAPAPEVAPTEIAPVEELAVQAPLQAVTRAPSASTAAGPEWWYQTLDDEEGPVPMLAVEQVPAEAVSFAAPPPPPPPPPAPELKPVTLAPKKLARTKPARPGPAAPPQPAVDMEALLARLRANPSDHEALLGMARGWVQQGDLNTARDAYDELVRAGTLLDQVLADLDGVTENHPDDVEFIRLMGDAHMKAGNLQKALKLYRQALKKL